MVKNHSLYIAWKNIKERCYNPNSSNYANYGGRGIAVCEEWKHDFWAFQKWALENGYKTGLSIDRIDNNKGYSPHNCKWSTTIEQANNKRNNRLLTYNGKTQTVAQWAAETGVSRGTISRRINALGWSVERALTETPVIGKNQTYQNLRGE